IVRRFNGFYGFELDESLRLKSGAGLLTDFYHALAIPDASPAISEFPLSGEKWAEFSSRIKARILEIGLENAPKRLSSTIVSDMLTAKQVLEEPVHQLTKTPRIPGLDGRKMSKSYGNAITLSESDEDIRKKTKVMVSDPARKRRTDPGNPDVCPVYD